MTRSAPTLTMCAVQAPLTRAASVLTAIYGPRRAREIIAAARATHRANLCRHRTIGAHNPHQGENR